MNIRLVLGDQLNDSISSLADVDRSEDVIWMCEVRNEATYAAHHQKKLALIFSAMRHFAAELTSRGYRVHYSCLDDEATGESFTAEMEKAVAIHAPHKLIVTEPSEYRVLQEIQSWPGILSVDIELRPDTRFLCSQQQFRAWAQGRKQWRMEYFYRELRRRYGVLMDGDQPVGGRWNFDSENRKPLTKKTRVPEPLFFKADAITRDVLALVEKRFNNNMGELHPFGFAVTRAQALQVLDRFIEERLSHFGDYQDAMKADEAWLFHSHISFYLNTGLLLPLECIQRAEQVFHDGKAPLNAVEGFIRQILGWREFVRGIYWHRMPQYLNSNFLEHQKPLPAFYWTGETDMACVRQCIEQTRREAYAHHIQRLMVTGNFALLAGINPQQVHEWYLAVYADAYEWVELPNTLGMSQFADGGVLASKPYISSGNYINRMSDYCDSCIYSVKQKTGPGACPFNVLYWHFLHRHRERLKNNPRLAPMYKTWEKMDEEKRATICADAERFLERV